MDTRAQTQPQSGIEDRYDKLADWPERRPTAIVFHADFATKTVYICGWHGARLLAVPFDQWPAEPWKL